MKAIFGIFGLLIVVAITGFSAKKQRDWLSAITVKPHDVSQILVSAATLGATAQQQSLQIQQQVEQSVDTAMQHGSSHS
jgi:flagellin-like protein